MKSRLGHKKEKENALHLDKSVLRILFLYVLIIEDGTTTLSGHNHFLVQRHYILPQYYYYQTLSFVPLPGPWNRTGDLLQLLSNALHFTDWAYSISCHSQKVKNLKICFLQVWNNWLTLTVLDTLFLAGDLVGFSSMTKIKHLNVRYG